LSLNLNDLEVISKFLNHHHDLDNWLRKYVAIYKAKQDLVGQLYFMELFPHCLETIGNILGL